MTSIKDIINQAKRATDYPPENIFYDNLFKQDNIKIGSELRIRLPNDFIIKEHNMQIILSDYDKLEREQRMECLRLAQMNGESTDEIIRRAKAFYKFIRKGK